VTRGADRTGVPPPGLSATGLIRRGEAYLSRHGVDGARPEAEALLAHLAGTSRSGLYAAGRVEPAVARSYARALCVRGRGTPLQHLIGRQAFFGLDLEVRPGVFVPRPETEVLVEAAVEALTGDEEPRVVDVGTGTGAVALALKHLLPGAEVVAVDRSEEAVDLARDNAARLGLDVSVRRGDLLGPVPAAWRGTVDLIVSNPPYVEAAEYPGLPREVRADPVEALVGGTEVHRRLAGEAGTWLAPGGWLVMEIGERQAAEVVAMLGRAGLAEAEVVRDLAGRDRVVRARLP
jgi:release factor glutamine methyltransferase